MSIALRTSGYRLLRAAALLGFGSGLTTEVVTRAALEAARSSLPFGRPFDITAAVALLSPDAPGWPARLQ